MGKVIWGLFCFFSGMHFLSQMPSEILSVRNKWHAVATGAGITALVHSSSAVSLSVCLLAKNGLPFALAAALLIGANIGSAITPFITTLGLYFPTDLLWAVVGLVSFCLPAAYKKSKTFLSGFCLILLGVSLCAEGAEALLFRLPSTEMIFRYPLVAWLCGILLTALLQSSAVTMALLQVALLRSPMSLAAVLPVLLGQNIGTTATAWLSLIGQKDKAAQHCAAFHTVFNLVGSLWAMPLYGILYTPLSGIDATPLSVAAANLIFNAANAAVFFIAFSRVDTRRL